MLSDLFQYRYRNARVGKMFSPAVNYLHHTPRFGNGFVVRHPVLCGRRKRILNAGLRTPGAHFHGLIAQRLPDG